MNKKEKLIHELFIGKVSDEIGVKKTLVLLTESKAAFKNYDELVNNGVLDDVKECLHPFNSVVSGDEGDFCTECQEYIGTNRL